MAISGARRRSNIWGQLAVSACVLLLPPLAMGAGVLYLGSSSEDVATAPEAVPGSATIAATRPEAKADGKGSFGLASADERPAAAELKAALPQPAVAARTAVPQPTVPQPAVSQPVVSQHTVPSPEAAQRPAAGPSGSKDSARFAPSAPVTLVHGGAAGEPTAVAEMTPAAEKPNEMAVTPAPAAAIAVPEEAANSTSPQAHAARKPRREAHAAARTRHVPTLGEIILGPQRRTR